MFVYDDITFIAVDDSHLTFLYQLRKDEDVNNNLFYQFPISQTGQFDWLKKMLADTRNKVFMVKYFDDIIGCVRLTDIDYLNQTIEVGSDIAKDWRGKGLATKVYNALCKYCFDYLNMNKVYLYVLESNQRASHVYTKCGFKPEGVLKDHKFKHGKRQNVLIMSRFRK